MHTPRNLLHAGRGEGERRAVTKAVALLFRNYHAKKASFDINRSASRVHSCKATINIVTSF